MTTKPIIDREKSGATSDGEGVPKCLAIPQNTRPTITGNEPTVESDTGALKISALRQKIRSTLINGIKKAWEYSCRCKERLDKIHSGLQKIPTSIQMDMAKNACLVFRMVINNELIYGSASFVGGLLKENES